MIFLLDIDEVKFTSKPKAENFKQLRERQKGRNAKYVTLDDLATAVSNGQTIVPVDLNGGVSDVDWKKQQLFMVDIDNKEKIITPKEALKKCLQLNVPPCLIYYSFSNTKEIPKYRMCFCCDTEITQEEDRQLIQDTLISMFSTADQACKNSSRIFFGSFKGCVCHKKEITFSIESIRKIAESKTINTNVEFEQRQIVDSNSQKEARNQELKELIARYPIENYFKDNSKGEYNPKTGFVNPCPICGHNDDFHIDTKKNIFKCFGENGGLGGNILTWLTKVEHLSLKDAIYKLKYELLEMPKPNTVSECSHTIFDYTQISTEEEYTTKYRALDKLYKFYNGITNGISTPPIKTGFNLLDNSLDGGIRPEQLIIIGAISSLGKTTFVLQAADFIAKSGQDVLIFSLEMSENELMSKSISRQTFTSCGINENDLSLAKTSLGITSGDRWKNYSKAEKEHINKAVKEYTQSAKHIYINVGCGNITVDYIRKQVENQIHLTNRKPIVIVDYLQILAPHSDRISDKQATDYNVTSLKRIARDFKLPVIAISSFNRTSYTSTAKMSAFKESGSIEYSSDILITLTLKNATDEEKTTKEKAVSNDIRTPRNIELTILKNRSGRTGDVIPYLFYAAFNTFVESNDSLTLKEITSSGSINSNIPLEDAKILQNENNEIYYADPDFDIDIDIED